MLTAPWSKPFSSSSDSAFPLVVYANQFCIFQWYATIAVYCVRYIIDIS